MSLLKFFIRTPFGINKMIDPFFVTAKCSLPVKELTDKNILLTYSLLIYKKLLRHECTWVLRNNLFFTCYILNVSSCKKMRNILLFHLYSFSWKIEWNHIVNFIKCARCKKKKMKLVRRKTSGERQKGYTRKEVKKYKGKRAPKDVCVYPFLFCLLQLLPQRKK